MQNGLKSLRLARYYSSVVLLNAFTLLFAFYLFNPVVFQRPAQAHPALQNTPTLPAPITTREVVSGKPARLVIERLGIDLQVDEGNYNQADGSWTLVYGRKAAYFAMPSALANDYAGGTLLYGHNNQFVFNALGSVAAGDTAKIYTENGHVLVYTYANSEELQPDDVSIFNYQGPPRLTLQTCTGNWYEKRSMFHFMFTRVEK